MQIASGKVVQGRVELDAELPDGASVTVIASDGDAMFEVDAETEERPQPSRSRDTLWTRRNPSRRAGLAETHGTFTASLNVMLTLTVFPGATSIGSGVGGFLA